MDHAPDDILTPEEAAELLRCHKRSVQRLLRSGALGGVMRQGRWRTTRLAVWRYSGIESEMMRAWAERHRPGGAERP